MLRDRYRLDQLLGQGGMGQVWRGHDLELGRDIAIKVLRPDSDSMSLDRFQREAQIAASLQHPGITVVHDVGRHEDRLFIVMELLVGRDLSMILSEYSTGLPPSRVLDLALQTVDALAAAHQRLIVHRDLKPSNLFVLAEDRLKICDFGIARDMNATSILTTEGHIFGTPAYMSPEQCNGESVDTRSDLYSLGCVLYAMLVGHPPFAGNDRAVMRQHSDAHPTPPRAHNQAIPERLEELVLGLLAKESAARPATAEVATTLKRIQDTPRQEVHTLPYNAPFTPARATPHSPPITPPYRRVQDTPRQRVHTPPVGAASFTSTQSRPKAPSGATPRSRSAALYPPSAKRLPTVVWLLPVAALVIVGLVIAFMPKDMPKNANDVMIAAETVAFSPDSKALAVGDYTNNVYIWNVATRKVTNTLKPYPDSALDVAFSPNGKLLAVAIWKGSLYLYNMTSLQAVGIFGGNADRFPYSVTFSHDGRFLTFNVDNYGNSGSDRAYLWSVSTHRVIWSFSEPGPIRPGGNHTNAVAFSPDGRFIATGGDSGKTYLWNITTRKLASMLTAASSRDVRSVAFSPDGKEVAVGDDNGNIYLWNVSTRTITGTLRNSNSQGIFSLMFSPDSKMLAAGGDDVAYLWDMHTHRIIKTDDTLSGPVDVAISPDGKTFVAAGTYVDLLAIHQRRGTLIRLTMPLAH